MLARLVSVVLHPKQADCVLNNSACGRVGEATTEWLTGGGLHLRGGETVLADPSQYDNPSYWLPISRWGGLNDFHFDVSGRGGVFGGLYDAVAQQVSGIQTAFISVLFTFASFMWRILGWIVSASANSGTLSGEFADNLNLYFVRYFNVLDNGTVYALLLTIGIVAVMWRYWKGGASQALRLAKQTFLPIGLLFAMVVSVPQFETGINDPLTDNEKGQINSAEGTGSPLWLHKTILSTADLVTEPVLNVASGLSDSDIVLGGVSTCDAYRAVIEQQYFRAWDSQNGVGETKTAGHARRAMPLLVSRIWEKSYLVGYGSAQFGDTVLAERASCLVGDWRNQKVSPVEMLAIWKTSCDLKNVLAANNVNEEDVAAFNRLSLFGCSLMPPLIDLTNLRGNSETARKARSEAAPSAVVSIYANEVFNASQTTGDRSNINTAHSIWAFCDFLNDDSGSSDNAREVAKKTNREIPHYVFDKGGNVENRFRIKFNDGDAYSRVAITSDRGDTRTQIATLDSRVLGLTQNTDDEQISAYGCATWLLGSLLKHPPSGTFTGNDVTTTFFIDGSENNEAGWVIPLNTIVGLSDKYIADRFDLNRFNAALSTSNQLRFLNDAAQNNDSTSAIRATSEGATRQLFSNPQGVDLVAKVRGGSFSASFLHAVFTLITAFILTKGLIGLSLGAVMSETILAIVIMTLPFTLLVAAIPVRSTSRLIGTVFRVAIGAALAHTIFVFIMTLMLVVMDIIITILGGVAKPDDLIFILVLAAAPLVAYKMVQAICKKIGFDLSSVKGAFAATSGIALGKLSTGNANPTAYVRRAVNKGRRVSATFDRFSQRFDPTRTQPRGGKAPKPTVNDSIPTGTAGLSTTAGFLGRTNLLTRRLGAGNVGTRNAPLPSAAAPQAERASQRTVLPDASTSQKAAPTKVGGPPLPERDISVEDRGKKPVFSGKIGRNIGEMLERARNERLAAHERAARAKDFIGRHRKLIKIGALGGVAALTPLAFLPLVAGYGATTAIRGLLRRGGGHEARRRRNYYASKRREHAERVSDNRGERWFPNPQAEAARQQAAAEQEAVAARALAEAEQVEREAEQLAETERHQAQTAETAARSRAAEVRRQQDQANRQRAQRMKREQDRVEQQRLRWEHAERERVEKKWRTSSDDLRKAREIYRQQVERTEQ